MPRRPASRRARGLAGAQLVSGLDRQELRDQRASRWRAHQHRGQGSQRWASSRRAFARVARTSPARAARTIVDGITHNRERVFLGVDSKCFRVINNGTILQPHRSAQSLTAASPYIKDRSLTAAPRFVHCARVGSALAPDALCDHPGEPHHGPRRNALGRVADESVVPPSAIAAISCTILGRTHMCARRWVSLRA
jgi:hypothetical protein